MKHLILKMALFVMCAISAGLMSCSGFSGNSDNDGMVNRGSWYITGFEWPHYGEPFESDNCRIYSDGASKDTRHDLAQLAENALSEIKQAFEIENNDIFKSKIPHTLTICHLIFI